MSEQNTVALTEESVLEVLKSIRPEVDFANSSDFIEKQILDSFDIVSIVAVAEEQFGIRVDGASILPESFASVQSILTLFQKSGR